MFRSAEQKLQNPLMRDEGFSSRAAPVKQLAIYTVEVLLSLLVVCGLFWVAFAYEPTVTVEKIERFPFERRDAFYSVTGAGEGGAVFAAGGFGKIIRSEDGGRTWTIQSTPTENHLQKVVAWDERSLLAVGDKNTVIVTRNAGKKWRSVNVPAYEWGEQLLSAHTGAGGRAWAVGNMGTVLFSENYGASWRMIHPKEDIVWNDVTRTKDGILWVAGEFGTLKRSADNGQSWERVSVPTEASLNAIAFADRERGVIVGLSGTILATADGGQNWEAVESGIRTHLYDVLWDGKTYRAVGDAGRILTAGEQGRKWRAEKLSPQNYSWYTDIAPLGEGYFISGAGAGVYTDGRWQQFTPGRQDYQAMKGLPAPTENL